LTADSLIKVTDWTQRVTSYDYDKNGRLKTVNQTNGTSRLSVYDTAGQLLQQKEIVIETGAVISQFDFEYDAAGNIIKEKTTPEADIDINLEMTYAAAANRLATYDGSAVQLDDDGNMISGPLSGDTANFAFDSRNRLMSAGETVYHYDAENQRVGVNQSRYVVNSQPALSQVLVKTEVDGTQIYYVYGLGLIGQEQNGEYLSYHKDVTVAQNSTLV
jgi:YD repeat-containing protein